MLRRFSVKVSRIVMMISIAVMLISWVVYTAVSYNVLREDFCGKNIDIMRQNIDKLNVYVDTIVKNFHLIADSNAIRNMLETGNVNARVADELASLRQMNGQCTGVFIKSAVYKTEVSSTYDSGIKMNVLIPDSFINSDETTEVYFVGEQLILASKIYSKADKEKVIGYIGMQMSTQHLTEKIFDIPERFAEESRMYFVSGRKVLPSGSGNGEQLISIAQRAAEEVHGGKIYVGSKLNTIDCAVVIEKRADELYLSGKEIFCTNGVIFLLFLIPLIIVSDMLKRSISEPLGELNRYISENIVNESAGDSL